MKNILLILPLLVLFSGLASAEPQKMKKDELFAKYGIVNNSIIPEDFDFDELRKVYARLYGEHHTEGIQAQIEEDLRLPELYEGFEAHNGPITFYYAEDVKNLKHIGLDDKDVKELGLEINDEIKKELSAGLSKDKFEEIFANTSYPGLRPLVARLSNDIYLTGLNGDCGSYGCPISITIRKNGVWEYPEASIFFKDCESIADKEHNNVSVYSCEIGGGKNMSWQSIAADYEPLSELMDRYYAFYEDYVQQYIMRKPIVGN